MEWGSNVRMNMSVARHCTGAKQKVLIPFLIVIFAEIVIGYFLRHVNDGKFIKYSFLTLPKAHEIDILWEIP